MTRELVKHNFWGVSLRVFLEKISIWSLRLSKESMQVGIIQSTEGLIRTKRQKEGQPALFELGSIFCLQAWVLFDSQVFGFRLNYTTSFPGFCRQHTLELLSLRNQVSQFLLYVCVLLMGSSPGKFAMDLM